MSNSLRTWHIASLILVMCTLAVMGQDSHYSQFYASPLTLNPAMTGKTQGDYRIGLMYRNQWRTIVKPLFVTPSAAFDLPFVFGNGKDAVGAGVLILNDQSNEGRFNTIMGMVSGAYHKGLGEKNKHQLSLGVQLGYVQKKLKTDELTFGNQYNPDNLEPEFSSGESTIDNSIGYFDFNAGLLWNSTFTEKFTLFGGASLFHITQPQETFIATTDDNSLPMRIVAHGGAEADLTEKFSLYPGILFMTQAKARETNFGLTGGYHFLKEADKNASFYLGGWYRWDDAVIAMTAIEYQNFRIGFSYDFTISDLSGSGNLRNHVGGFELSLIYIGKFQQLEAENSYLFCPRF